MKAVRVVTFLHAKTRTFFYGRKHRLLVTVTYDPGEWGFSLRNYSWFYCKINLVESGLVLIEFQNKSPTPR